MDKGKIVCLFTLVVLTSLILPGVLLSADTINGLIGYWSLDEGSGVSATDGSGSGNRGTLINDTGWASGKLGSALSFDGVDDYVDLGNPASLQPTSLTVSAWIKSSDGGFIFRNWGDGFGLHLGASSNFGAPGKISFWTHGSSGQAGVTSAQSYNDDQWHHVAGTFNGSTVSLYVDGNFIGSTSGTLSYQTTRITIGSDGGLAGYFKGLVDDVRIYNRSLAPADILELYSNVSSTLVPNWADTWNGMHSFLVFAPYGGFTNQYISSIAPRYGFGWSPKYRNALIAGNPSFIGATYESATQDGVHDYAWVRANHPDWILYGCDRVTPMLQYFYGAPSLDITNPEVIDYKFNQVNHGDNVAWDNFFLSNDFQLPNGTYGHACGVYDKNGNWVQKFAGNTSYAEVLDPQWTDASIAYAATIRNRLHALPIPRLLIVNVEPKVITGDPVRAANLIAAVDGLMVEGGNFGPASVGDPRMIWLKNIHFAEALNNAGKAYYSLESPTTPSDVVVSPTTTIETSYIQFTLASYLLAKGRTAALSIVPPGTLGFFNNYDGMFWPHEFQAATAIGVPCAAMSQVAGINGTENGLFMREHSGGVSLVNASRTNSYSAVLPAGNSYRDLYGNPAGSPLTMQPVTGMVLLKASGPSCSNGAPIPSQTPPTPPTPEGPATGDTAPPVISSISITNITSSTAIVRWNTNEAANSQIEFVTSCPSTGCLSSVDSTLTTSHVSNLSNLAPQSFYTLRIKSTDSAGNQAISSNQVFATTAASTVPPPAPGPVAGPPVITSISITNITSSTATVSWNTDKPADGQLQFVTSCPSTGCLSPVDSALTTSHTHNVSGLVSNRFYTFRIKSTDSAGNPAISSNQVFVTTAGAAVQGPAPSPDVPPVISSISITNITPTTATVSWNTDKPADGQIQFVTSCPSTGCLSSLDSALTTSHVYNISNLAPNRFYTFRIKSTDSGGSPTISSNQVFITATAPDPAQ